MPTLFSVWILCDFYSCHKITVVTHHSQKCLATEHCIHHHHHRVWEEWCKNEIISMCSLFRLLEDLYYPILSPPPSPPKLLECKIHVNSNAVEPTEHPSSDALENKKVRITSLCKTLRLLFSSPLLLLDNYTWKWDTGQKHFCSFRQNK